MLQRTIEKRIQAKVEGQVLRFGRCLCALCGKKGKMGTTTRPTPQNPVVKILCVDCAVKDLMERHNIGEKDAKKRHEKLHDAQERLVKAIIQKYKDTGRKLPRDFKGLSECVQPGLEWWQNGLSEKERWEISDLSKDEQKKKFADSPIVPQKNEPIVKEEEAGRNDPCPCGSGKKYKKCCLLKAA